MAGNGTTFLHLLGKTGTGKSSTGNTILNQKVFSAKSSLSAVTSTIQMHEGFINSRKVVVADGPGLVGVNTGVSHEAINQFKQVVDENRDSKHVFLIVCRYGERFTEEDEEMIKCLKAKFGGKIALENHSIVVLTCGDNFERDTEDEGLTFEQWCQQQGGTFSSLRRDCGNRVLLVDNSRNPGKQAGSFLGDLDMEISRLDSRGVLILQPSRQVDNYEKSCCSSLSRFFKSL
ncbi:immune-associated nucleotide-binding protein 6 [Elysia marginata]|uniref:Immune-associated nucleotide-binding protein 6 n=1 Tax=Elysia marginata TaxID=1093978 RepID=A0AAV4K0Z1_9GAST|nr:immune-associated nucleotide-binding protein 6 [Elysia marginata]